MCLLHSAIPCITGDRDPRRVTHAMYRGSVSPGQRYLRLVERFGNVSDAGPFMFHASIHLIVGSAMQGLGLCSLQSTKFNRKG
jgi:hypothetical protein